MNVADLDVISTTSYDLFWCGASFDNDRVGADAHWRSCEICQAYVRDRTEAREAEKRRIVLTDMN